MATMNKTLLYLDCSGGEVEADRTHTKRKENTTGCILPLPRQIGVRFQGMSWHPPVVTY